MKKFKVTGRTSFISDKEVTFDCEFIEMVYAINEQQAKEKIITDYSNIINITAVNEILEAK